MVAKALEAAERLARDGVQCRVINMATLQPMDEEAVVQAASETGAVVTAEEHYRNGGLGSLVAQVLGRRVAVPLEVVALDGYAESGKPDQLLAKYGLGADDVESNRLFSRRSPPASRQSFPLSPSKLISDLFP
jgi:transketolase